MEEPKKLKDFVKKARLISVMKGNEEERLYSEDEVLAKAYELMLEEVAFGFTANYTREAK